MKAIIALKGISKSGKSTTIKKTYEIIRRNHENIIVEYEQLKIDIKAIIIIGSIKIGFESQGDPGGRLAESLTEFKNKGCHIILCATRTYGSTVNLVNNLKTDYDVHWVIKQKSDVSRIDYDNEIMANTLVQQIETLLSAV